MAFNPEPFADFFDAFLLGDGEEVTVEFLDCVETNRHFDRQELLKELAGIEGVYVPSLYAVTYHDDETIKAREPMVKGIPLGYANGWSGILTGLITRKIRSYLIWGLSMTGPCWKSCGAASGLVASAMPEWSIVRCGKDQPRYWPGRRLNN